VALSHRGSRQWNIVTITGLLLACPRRISLNEETFDRVVLLITIQAECSGGGNQVSLLTGANGEAEWVYGGDCTAIFDMCTDSVTLRV
jgi:predicted metal-binding protein